MQNQPQQYVQQQPTVVMVPPQALEDKFKQSALSQMKLLSIFQIVIGCLCIVVGVMLTVLSNVDIYGYYYSITGYPGASISIGNWYIIVGGIGIGAVRWNSSCWIISAMVLNIIGSSCWCTALGGLSATEIAGTSSYGRSHDLYYREALNTHLTLHCLLLVLAIAGLVITIWSAALCCGAVCRCCKSSQMITQYYNTTTNDARWRDS